MRLCWGLVLATLVCSAQPDPARPGPYPVGVTTTVFVDHGRTDKVTNQPRTLVTEIWYPATDDARSLPKNRYSEFFPGGVRVTPGLGLQLMTPLGPMRLDAAYNGYGTQPGPLYEIEGSVLTLRDTDYQRPPAPTVLGRIQWHFSVGLAF